MFDFLKRTKFKKDNLKGMAALMYQDVSEDVWDQEHLTKRNLDFSIESTRFIDLYVEKLMNTEEDTQLLTRHFDNFVVRIGTYIGEVIKNNIPQEFNWYEFDSVYAYSSALDEIHGSERPYSLLYSKKKDIVILPLLETAYFLEGTSGYSNFLAYVEEMVRKNSY